MLVGRNDKAPKLHDAVVHNEVNVAVVDPGLGPDAVVLSYAERHYQSS